MHPLLSEKQTWRLEEKGTDPVALRNNETLFSLGNGHLGTRGSLEESVLTGEYSDSEVTLVNSFYDIEPIQYGEWAYGYAQNHQTIIPLPNGKQIFLQLDGETFDLNTGIVKNHQRQLDLKKGLLIRSFRWENSLGNEVEVEIERLVSYAYPEILAQKITVTPLVEGSELILTTVLDDLAQAPKANVKTTTHDPRIKDQAQRRYRSSWIEENEKDFLHVEANHSGLHLVVGATSNYSGFTASARKEKGQEATIVRTKKGVPVSLERFVGYGSIFHHADELPSALTRLAACLDEVRDLGYAYVKDMQIRYMKKFWEMGDIQITGDNYLQTGLRFNLFHLNQAAGRDGRTNIPAKGLTGEGYEGHYFWDTEMYMLPYFTFTQPEVARQLLRYRYSILPKARNRAREMGIQKGAWFAWRTINGEEASAYYPAGTAQVHINADIAHAVYTYIKATGDTSFSQSEGLELLVETARFWVSYGHFDEERGNAFVLNGVTGPDEYTAIVNNNFYTNLLAKHNLLYAEEIVSQAVQSEVGRLTLAKLAFQEEELGEWAKAAQAMFLPYDEEKKLTMQDDSIFHKKLWDFQNTPKDNYPLLLHYHPLIIYRHQVNKQADTVLAQMLFSQEFSLEQKQRDYFYYESITTHDSSLSRSVFGMMASNIGDLKKAYRYFMDTALMDITDMQANTKDGIHAANMGGTWMSIVYGFGGMRLEKETLRFSPRLPEEWNALTFKLQFQGRVLEVRLQQDGTNYRLWEGLPLEIFHFGERHALRMGEPTFLPTVQSK